ncbi:bifunctional 2-polyprenyl-6-hydroxyphenol methylase/3-demethylubiquinol 3-O-methyltransferase UbiG [Catellatospora sp. TT07R-123]|uniref:class I SAM-dependent methyltransferase n=1 Tax=Catellatospora sp. TT07R-123 TaxID=2733863 RepID=UPI001BB30224|nr:class I SAM-dependent methyltransferase [Catellatospora sp. TT07R-123]
MAINEETYGPAGATFYEEYFPIDDRARDTATFLARCVRDTGAGEPMVLELGIGTGRVAIPLAEHGMTVYGVDLAPAMLEILRTKPQAHRLRVTVGDMTDAATLASLSGGTRYDVVYCVFGTLTALPDAAAQRRCLAAAASVLADNGRLVLEMPVPDLSTFDKSRRRVRHLGRHGDGTIVETARLDPVAQTIDFEVAVFSPTSGLTLQPVHSRYVWPHELDLMAELAGLQPLARYGSWTGDPLGVGSAINVSVYVARAQGASQESADA